MLSGIDSVKKTISAGQEFFTPSKRAIFSVEKVTSDQITIKTSGGTKIRIPLKCFETVIGRLPTDTWMPIGARKGTPDPGTLDAIVQQFTHGVTAASYVAPILEYAGFAKIDRGRPNRIRRK